MSAVSQPQRQQQEGQYDFVIQCQDLTKLADPIATGIGFLDHMIDQLNSHAQIGVTIRSKQQENSAATSASSTTSSKSPASVHSPDHLALLMQSVGAQLGAALRTLLPQPQEKDEKTTTTSRFCCPLDEALVVCELLRNLDNNNNKKEGRLAVFTLPPYGKYPRGGREFIGQMPTVHLQEFWSHLAKQSGLEIRLDKIRGDNAHHIVEATFKAFSRALRNLLDGVNTNDDSDDGVVDDDTVQILQPRESNNNSTGNRNRLEQMYGPNSENAKTSIALHRQATIERSTKETGIHATLKLNGSNNDIKVDTGIATLDRFFQTLVLHANMALHVTCKGDLWIDDHHTAEDVAIAVGQVLNTALGTKAGLNRMWSAVAAVPQQQQQQEEKQQQPSDNVNTADTMQQETPHKALVEVTMDLSNRPCFRHNLPFEYGLEEKVGDLSLEMMEHVLDSLVMNARMTVHIVYRDGGNMNNSFGNDTHNHHLNHANVIQAVAVAFGKALKYCSMVDCRRAGATASSKGTLSV